MTESLLDKALQCTPKSKRLGAITREMEDLTIAALEQRITPSQVSRALGFSRTGAYFFLWRTTLLLFTQERLKLEAK